MFYFFNNENNEKFENVFQMGKLFNHNCTENNFKSVELDSLNKNKKSILILPGNPTDSLYSAYGYVKCIDGLLDSNLKKTCDIYCIAYVGGEPLRHDGLNEKYNYNFLAQKLFLPYVTNHGKRVPLEMAKNSLNNLVVFGHSAGAFVMDETLKFFAKQLYQLNYSQQEIEDIFKQITFITYSPYDMINSDIKGIYFTPLYDSLGSAFKAVSFISEKSRLKSSSNDFVCRKTNSYLDSNMISSLKHSVNTNKILFLTDNKNSLVIIPDLINKVTREDHGLSGIVKYSRGNPYATNVGKLTSKLLSKIMNTLTFTKGATISELYNNCKKELESAPYIKE